MNINTASLDAHAMSTYVDNAHKLRGSGIGAFILNIIPTTSFDALARNDGLQVLFFAISSASAWLWWGSARGRSPN